jgi:hypothetical protein
VARGPDNTFVKEKAQNSQHSTVFDFAAHFCNELKRREQKETKKRVQTAAFKA